MSDHKKYAFTLIELLLVIVIIGVLAGVSLAIINPAVVMRRGQEGVLRSTVAKMCDGLVACGIASSSINECDEFAEIGVTLPTDARAQRHFIYKVDDPTVKFVGIGGGLPPSSGNLRSCIFYCVYNFLTGAIIPLSQITTATTYNPIPFGGNMYTINNSFNTCGADGRSSLPGTLGSGCTARFDSTATNLGCLIN